MMTRHQGTDMDFFKRKEEEDSVARRWWRGVGVTKGEGGG